MKVAFLGPKATFSDLVVREMFPDGELIPFPTIPDCLDAVMEEEVDVTVVPLENTLEGSVNITLDYLIHEINLPIIGEVTTPVRQHLLVHPSMKEKWQEVTKVYSHPHAIAQCHKFLHSQLRRVPCENASSTAAAAKLVMEHPELKLGAIANQLAASEYGLEIAQENIHDFDFNHTKFIVLAKQPLLLQPKKVGVKGHKTTVMITLPTDSSGALHQVLSAFAWRKLNLSKIESRPMKTGLGNYFFIIDIEQEIDEVLIPGAIGELEALGCSVTILGSYPYYEEIG